MSGPSWKSWQSMEFAMNAAIDTHAEGLFVHPGDAMDAAQAAAKAPSGPHEGSTPAISDIFPRIMAACLPPRSFGTERRWRAGYYRLVALGHRIFPEMCDGMTQAEIAERLGITHAAFKKQLEHADSIISHKATPAASNCKKTRVLSSVLD